MAEETMVTVELTLTLPTDLVREAEENSLLAAEAVEDLLRAAVQHRRVEQLFAAGDRLAALPAPPVPAAEIEAEIQAVRAERQAAHASRR